MNLYVDMGLMDPEEENDTDGGDKKDGSNLERLVGRVYKIHGKGPFENQLELEQDQRLNFAGIEANFDR